MRRAWGISSLRADFLLEMRLKMISGTISSNNNPNPTGKTHQYFEKKPASSGASSPSAVGAAATPPLATPVLATMMSLSRVPVMLSSKSCSLPSKGWNTSPSAGGVNS